MDSLSIAAKSLLPLPRSSTQDVNDNVPFFTSSIYEASVTEGAQIGTSVLQVSAHDKDLGLNGEVGGYFVVCAGAGRERREHMSLREKNCVASHRSPACRADFSGRVVKALSGGPGIFSTARACLTVTRSL